MKRILLFPDDAPANGGNTDAPQTTPAPVKLTAEQEKKIAVQAYYDAPDRAAKAAVFKQYPVLATVFSTANHS